MVALPQTSGVFDRTVHPSELHVPVPGSGAVTSVTVVAVVGMIVVAVVTALLRAGGARPEEVGVITPYEGQRARVCARICACGCMCVRCGCACVAWALVMVLVG